MKNDFGSFRAQLTHELDTYLSEEKAKYPQEDLLKIDLHCHDYNSDKPDELLGRILNVPETWLKSERLIKVLKSNDCQALTITNHNNARSCYEMQEKGHDILNAAEFTCTIPEDGIFIHVLTYGFTKKQEKKLNKLRRNLYHFLAYCHDEDIPTIWAHPLYNYYAKKVPDMSFFYKLSLLFERFEILNGQRETWQNLLVKNWIESLTPEVIDALAEEHNIELTKYCRNPYKKSFSGGSDSHMGIFSGCTGSYLYVPKLQERLKKYKSSELALEAIKLGNIIPYGSYTRHEKLAVAFLEYFCQVTMHYDDPGLMRIILHKGTTKDKVMAYFLSNVVSELQSHKTTMSFIKLFHKSMQGKSPGWGKKLLVPKSYKKVFKDVMELARVRKANANTLADDLHRVLYQMYSNLNQLFFNRLEGEIEGFGQNVEGDFDFNRMIEQIELPSKIRDVIGGSSSKKSHQQVDLVKLLDGLSFPLLSSSIILAANFTSTKVLFNHRELLNGFAKQLGKLEHPKRMLWLTDTFNDKNGVSVVLQSFHAEIKRHSLPIDILVCSDEIEADDHLLVVKPVSTISHPMYPEQKLRVPDFMQVHALFDHHEYDRIMCSTEGPMGMAALYLKNAFSVPTHFYMHTDWVMFGKKTLGLNADNSGRLRRALRGYYGLYDRMFVLNTDHQKWLSSSTMGFSKERISLTAHWIEDHFVPTQANKLELFNIDASQKVMLFVGRISKEKGVLEIPKIYKEIKASSSDVKMVFVGTGPAEQELKEAMPEAEFVAWVDHEKLPDIYSAADLLLFPSKFDTFSCVVLEAMSCGLPVLAYSSKGPKDIIDHNVNGYLAKTKGEMVKYASEYLNDVQLRTTFSNAAITRASAYKKEDILNQLLSDVGLEGISKEVLETA